MNAGQLGCFGYPSCLKKTGKGMLSFLGCAPVEIPEQCPFTLLRPRIEYPAAENNLHNSNHLDLDVSIVSLCSRPPKISFPLLHEKAKQCRSGNVSEYRTRRDPLRQVLST